MNYKNEKENNNVKPQTCPRCGGSGKVSGKRDDTDICASDSEKVVCPLCHGSGKIKSRRCSMRLHHGCRPKRIFLKRPRPGRGGRPSLGKNILLQPGAPTADYTEDETEAMSRQETSSAQQSTQFDVDSSSNVFTDQENLPQELLQNETANETETAIGDLPESLHPCNDQQKGPLHPEQDIAALLQRAAVLGLDPFFPLIPDDYQEGILPNIPGPTGAVTGSNERIVTAPPLNLPAPGVLNQPDPLDVIGTPDPAGFQLSTDVEGDTGY